jgi:bifunctional DNA-binding transcriptional regulator/antitoxin component of YhaV-PrlF toxin-antitoxin module
MLREAQSGHDPWHGVWQYNVRSMKGTIRMDASGRLVLPRVLRERLNLRGGMRLRADVVAGHIELVPVVAEVAGVVVKKSGIAVLRRAGAVRARIVGRGLTGKDIGDAVAWARKGPG